MTPSDRDAIGLEKIRATWIEMGWGPRRWDEVVGEVRLRLPEAKVQLFIRYHKSFVGYPTEATLKKFYGLAYAEGLGDLLASFRFARLTRMLAWLSPMLDPGMSILEIGAGAGPILQWLTSEKKPRRLSAVDWVPEARLQWPNLCTEPQDGETFDTLLCLDALGETHSDEDDAIANGKDTSLETLGTLIEQRYGFATKLAPWRHRLSPTGHLYLTEPIPYPWFWNGLAHRLQQDGWSASVLSLPKGLSDPDGFGLKIELQV